MNPLKSEEAKDLLLNKIALNWEFQTETNMQPIELNQLVEDDFLLSEELVSNQSNGEVERYYNTVYTGDLKILNGLPMMKQILEKVNTSLPSSDSVEMFFSVAGDCTKKRAKSTNQHFENTLLYNINIKIDSYKIDFFMKLNPLLTKHRIKIFFKVFFA